MTETLKKIQNTVKMCWQTIMIKPKLSQENGTKLWEINIEEQRT